MCGNREECLRIRKNLLGSSSFCENKEDFVRIVRFCENKEDYVRIRKIL